MLHILIVRSRGKKLHFPKFWKAETTNAYLWGLLAYQSACWPSGSLSIPGSVAHFRVHSSILALLTSCPTSNSPSSLASLPQVFILLVVPLFCLCVCLSPSPSLCLSPTLPLSLCLYVPASLMVRSSPLAIVSLLWLFSPSHQQETFLLTIPSSGHIVSLHTSWYSGLWALARTAHQVLRIAV